MNAMKLLHESHALNFTRASIQGAFSTAAHLPPSLWRPMRGHRSGAWQGAAASNAASSISCLSPAVGMTTPCGPCGRRKDSARTAQHIMPAAGPACCWGTALRVSCTALARRRAGTRSTRAAPPVQGATRRLTSAARSLSVGLGLPVNESAVQLACQSS